jgi:hypothetical protein
VGAAKVRAGRDQGQGIEATSEVDKNGPVGCGQPRLNAGVDVMMAFFANFRRFLPFFGDFCQFSAQKLAFFSITNVLIKILRNLALL